MRSASMLHPIPEGADDDSAQSASAGYITRPRKRQWALPDSADETQEREDLELQQPRYQQQPAAPFLDAAPQQQQDYLVPTLGETQC